MQAWETGVYGHSGCGTPLAFNSGMNTLPVPAKEGHLVLGSSEDALTVCVLDDEQAMVEMLQESLRCLGFSSIGTSDPQNALDLVDQGRARVVMSDIKMPGRDGLQFLE